MMLLLRVFPDIESRLAALTLLQPTLWDPSRIVDVVLDLDHPVSGSGVCRRVSDYKVDVVLKIELCVNGCVIYFFSMPTSRPCL